MKKKVSSIQRGHKERALTRREYAEMQKNNQQYVKKIDEREQDPESFFWQGIDPRRRQEFADGGMVAEDDRGMANLSETAVYKEFPKAPFYSTPLIDTLELD